MSTGRYAIVWQLATCTDWTSGQREHMARLALRRTPVQADWDRIDEIRRLLEAGENAKADAAINALLEGGNPT